MRIPNGRQLLTLGLGLWGWMGCGQSELGSSESVSTAVEESQSVRATPSIKGASEAELDEADIYAQRAAEDPIVVAYIQQTLELVAIAKAYSDSLSEEESATLLAAETPPEGLLAAAGVSRARVEAWATVAQAAGQAYPALFPNPNPDGTGIPDGVLLPPPEEMPQTFEDLPENIFTLVDVSAYLAPGQGRKQEPEVAMMAQVVDNSPELTEAVLTQLGTNQCIARVAPAARANYDRVRAIEESPDFNVDGDSDQGGGITHESCLFGTECVGGDVACCIEVCLRKRNSDGNWYLLATLAQTVWDILTPGGELKVEAGMHWTKFLFNWGKHAFNTVAEALIVPRLILNVHQMYKELDEDILLCVDECTGVEPGLNCPCIFDWDCDEGFHCNQNNIMWPWDNECAPLKRNGEVCNMFTSDQCRSGCCKYRPASNLIRPVCRPPRFCRASRPNGRPCVNNAECDSGFCHQNQCSECKRESDCASDEYCDDGDILGVLGASTCQPERGNGEGCATNQQCRSGCCKNGFLGIVGKECSPASDCRNPDPD